MRQQSHDGAIRDDDSLSRRCWTLPNHRMPRFAFVPYLEDEDGGESARDSFGDDEQGGRARAELYL